MTAIEPRALIIKVPDTSPAETKQYIKQALINSLRWYAGCMVKRDEDTEHVITITDLLNALEE
jgi:hypothetical protein